MNIGLFGGTFDPIHKGHTALARAARDHFNLGRIEFVPSHIPPHKSGQPVAPYFHRYAMVVLATMAEKSFVPSLLEAPVIRSSEKTEHERPSPQVNYSIDTVLRVKKTLRKSDRLFFLIGIDAFEDIAKWREPEALLRECEFIVGSRPGYSLADVAHALPEKLRPKPAATRLFTKLSATGDLALAGVTLHLIGDVNEKASATAVREAVKAKRPLTRFVDPPVAEYIRKMALYKKG
ncbi:MAG: nicotinate (nicotinamide) nucleotide adenylyltransferase [Terriglobales bacterium]